MGPNLQSHGLERRDVLRASLAVGGGLLIGFAWPSRASASLAPLPDRQSGDFVPNAFVRIAPDGKVTVIINKSEMGQGVSTSLAMLLAEELDADWSTVGFEFAPVDPAYNHPGMPMQFTGGSMSVMAMSEPLLRAGAAARLMLLIAAAEQWGVPATECSTERGSVQHAASSRRMGYGELVGAAARVPVPKHVVLKDPKNFTIVGQPTRRLDTPAKLDGTAEFGIDVVRPGMLTALVAHPPVFGGRPVRWNSAAALAVPGVVKVFAVSSGVAVVAQRFWAAKRARDLLAVEWDEGANARISSSDLRAQYRALSREPGLVAKRVGDTEAAFGGAARTLEADYEVPYLAHAPMEPLNCVVEIRNGECDVWAGTQFQTMDHAAAARTAGLPPEKVRLHTTFLGGGFGRRACPASDYIVEAVEVAKQAGVPIKLIWTRDDDMRGGYYRPMFQSRLMAALDASGTITGWKHTLVGQSFIAGTPFEAFLIKDGIDGTSVEGAEDVPYALPNVLVDLHTTQVGVPTLWWRSVGHTHTAFAVESFIDELAHATKQDPIELRRKLLVDEPRHLGVLNAAVRAAEAKPLPHGHARGVAVHHSFSSYVAHVVEASLERGAPRVHRVVCAVDCGRVVNPDTVVAQLEGATGFALTAALYGEITLVKGRVQQSNFHDYRMVRMHEMPPVEVVLVPSTEPSTGVGEPGVPPVAPALCNALFAATGKRVRHLPIRMEELS